MTDHNPSLEERKIDVLFDQARGALASSTLAAVIVVLVYREYAAPSVLIVWLSIYSIFNACRYYLIRRSSTQANGIRDKRRLFHIFLAVTIVTGSMWGAIGAYIIQVSPLHHAAVMILLSGYLIMGASITYAVFHSVYLAFTVPLISPIILYLTASDDIAARTYGVLLIIFYGYSIFGALRYRRMTGEFLAYQYDNASLLQNLQEEKAEASRLNRELETDLAKLRRTEEQLKLEKDKAEELANKLMTLSSQDGLTGIANRRHFDEFLANEWNRAIRSQTPLSLIMCDIDHFKTYNDHYGHQQGDRCLMRISDVLQQYARRGGDLAARYGGEEFMLVLPETSLENATQIAEQIRESVQDIAIPHRASETDNIVTVSFGVSTIVPRRNQQSRLLVSMADKALYEAKQQGRNRVVASSPSLLPPPEQAAQSDVKSRA